MKSSTRFSQAPQPPALKCGFPTFHYRAFSFCCLPIFFLKKVQVPFMLFSTSDKIPSRHPPPPHWNTPSKVYTYSFNTDPDVPPLTELGL